MPLRAQNAPPSAHPASLTIRCLLNVNAVSTRRQEIVYRDKRCFNHADLRERIGRLAKLLTRCVVEQGTTVATLDGESHRYLDCHFAALRLGAVLQTANIRLSSEQTLVTLSPGLAESARAPNFALLGGYDVSQTGFGVCVVPPSRLGGWWDDPNAMIRSGVPIPLLSARIVADGRN